MLSFYPFSSFLGQTLQGESDPSSPPEERPFLMTVFNGNTGTGFDLKINLVFNDVDCYIDWGDGTPEEHFVWSPGSSVIPSPRHLYPDSSEYQISVRGVIPNLRYGGDQTGSAAKIKSVDQWGDNYWKLAESMFEGCDNLISLPAGGNFGQVVNFSRMCAGCLALNVFPSINLSSGLNLSEMWTESGIETIETVYVNQDADLTDAFYYASSLQSADIRGLASDISFDDCQLTQESIDNILFFARDQSFNLPSSLRTMRVVGCPGAATFDTVLAGSKGWDVIGGPPFGISGLTIPDFTNAVADKIIIGTEVQVSPGTWGGQPTSYEIRWFLNGSTLWEFEGVTNVLFVSSLVSQNDLLKVRVIPVNGFGADSNGMFTAEVQFENPSLATNNTLPSISLTVPEEGTSVFPSSQGNWDGLVESFTYAWYLCDSSGSIWSGAVSNDEVLLITSAMNGHWIRLGVTANNAAGSSSEAISSNYIGPVTSPETTTTEEETTTTEEQTTTTEEETTTTEEETTTTEEYSGGGGGETVSYNGGMTISGGNTYGSTIYLASVGSWSNAYSFSYQWRLLGPSMDYLSEISGATNDSLYISPETVPSGHYVQCVVTGYGAAESYSASSEVTGPFSTYPPSLVSSPFIAGITQEGQTLYADPGSWEGYISNYTFQWAFSDSGGSVTEILPDETNQELTLQSAHVSMYLVCIVHAVGDGSSTEAITPPVGPISSL
jgi:hypothetical protein